MRQKTHIARGVGAFTLMEMVISLALLSLILAASMAVVALAARSAPDPDDPLTRQLAMQAAVEQIGLDAAEASTVEMPDANTLVLRCDDVTGDGVEDTIEYAWSGKAGDPMTRALNGTPRTIATNIQSARFIAQARLDATSGSSTTVVKSDQWLAGVPRIGTTGSTLNIRSNQYAQRFVARLPSDATAWSLTSVSLWMATDGLAESQGAVQVWTDNKGEPGTMLAQRNYVELGLKGSAGKETFAFSLTGLDPKAAYWIVVKATLLTTPGSILESATPIASDQEMLARASGGSGTWTITSDASMLFEVRGDVTRAAFETVVESRASALLATVSDGRQGASMGTRLVQRPLLVAGVESDVVVSADQTLLDAVAGTVGGVVDATGDLLGGLLGGK